MIYEKHKDRETLERLKRWPQLKSRFPKVRIYSAEHGAYWRGSGNGYTHNPLESDVLDCDEAFRKTKHCGSEKRIQFVSANGGDNRNAPAR